MAKPQELHLGHWNQIVESFHSESDRGAAVLAAGYTENALALFLKSKVVDAKAGATLFDSMGPLSTFSQRIAIARAFGLIEPIDYESLTLVRKARNHFAHHPLHANFADMAVDAHCQQMRGYEWAVQDTALTSKAQINRRAYLLTCGITCARLAGYPDWEEEPDLPPDQPQPD